MSILKRPTRPRDPLLAAIEDQVLIRQIGGDICRFSSSHCDCAAKGRMRICERVELLARSIIDQVRTVEVGK